MEAPLAALNSSKFYDLIRSLHPRREAGHAEFDILKAESHAVRRLAEARLPTANGCDDEWLGRVELRGPDDVIRFLEEYKLPAPEAVTVALFVDDRCGVIRTEHVDLDGLVQGNGTASILGKASNCQAGGVILATHDLSGSRGRSPAYRQLTIDLRCKGEAIDVFLLDHFFLTDGGWRRMFARQPAERP